MLHLENALDTVFLYNVRLQIASYGVIKVGTGINRARLGWRRASRLGENLRHELDSAFVQNSAYVTEDFFDSEWFGNEAFCS